MGKKGKQFLRSFCEVSITSLQNLKKMSKENKTNKQKYMPVLLTNIHKNILNSISKNKLIR